MSKAFTKEPDDPSEVADDDAQNTLAAPLPAGSKNYITPGGYERLRSELLALMDDERPKVVEAVHWAAKNGDRSENGDYLYGKKRLREIDRRIRFLTGRLEGAERVDPSTHFGGDQVFFGATVRYLAMDAQAADSASDREHCITILGVDEADSSAAQVSWISPIARALLKSRVGDVVKLQTPGGGQEVEILQITYPAPAATV
ncbi:MAG: transcription elongation factor GreB [Variovorax sp.]